MRSTLIILSFFVLSLCASCCKVATIDDVATTDDGSKIVIHFLYGLGGPHRESLTCFAGEYIFMLVAIPSAIIPEKSVATLDWIFWAHSSDKRSFCNHSPIALRPLGNTNKQISFRFIGIQQQIPGDSEGSYDLALCIQCDDEVIAEKSVRVDIKSDNVFGLRSMAFLHGNIPFSGDDHQCHSLIGSNIFMVGERIAIYFVIGGVSIIANSEHSKIHIKLSVVNEKEESIIVADETRLYIDWTRTIFSIPSSLPGKYKVLIDVQNLATQEVVKHELPLYIFDYACLLFLNSEHLRSKDE